MSSAFFIYNAPYLPLAQSGIGTYITSFIRTLQSSRGHQVLYDQMKTLCMWWSVLWRFTKEKKSGNFIITSWVHRLFLERQFFFRHLDLERQILFLVDMKQEENAGKAKIYTQTEVTLLGLLSCSKRRSHIRK